MIGLSALARGKVGTSYSAGKVEKGETRREASDVNESGTDREQHTYILEIQGRGSLSHGGVRPSIFGSYRHGCRYSLISNGLSPRNGNDRGRKAGPHGLSKTSWNGVELVALRSIALT